MNVISFSLYGDSQKYLQGAIRNVELAKQFYPGWQCLFFISRRTVEDHPVEMGILNSFLEPVFCEVMSDDDAVNPLCWRFLVADLPGVDRFIVRDADSRPSQRELDAVNQWIESGLPFHTMRDHPAHGRFIHGGMWGAVGGFLPNMRQSYIDWWNSRGKDYKGTDPDQQFLEDVITPLVKNNCMQHDSFYAKQFGALPFPSKRIGQRFVGEVVSVLPDGSEEYRQHDYIQIPIEP